MEKNVFIFGAENSSSRHTDIRKENGERPTQGLHDTTTTSEVKYSINFTALKKEILFKEV